MKYLAAKSRLSILSDLKAVEIFVSIAETRSLTRTAQKLSIAPSTVSKKVAELEERAKVRLLNRSTRKVTITDSGQEFYRHCVKLMNEAENAEHSLTTRRDSPVGRVRVTVPVALGERKVTPLIRGFLQRYPGIEVEVETSARTMSLLDEGYDLSIRLMPASEVTADDTVLSPNERLFCASPAYLGRRGTPHHPEELAGHSCLTVRVNGHSDVWQYLDKGRTCKVTVSGPLSSNNANMIADAAADGIGIALLGSFVVRDYITSGRLVNILPGFQPRDTVVAAIVSDRSLASRHVRAFVDYLKEVWLPEERFRPAAALPVPGSAAARPGPRLVGAA